MKVFIGSSNEAVEMVNNIAVEIENNGHEPMPWYKQFIAGDTTFETLEELAQKVDAAIFIFNGDDKTWYRDKVLFTVRNNVLFEYGLFSSKLGRQNVAFCNYGDPHIPSNLYGITYIDMNKPFQGNKRISEWLNRCYTYGSDLRDIKNIFLFQNNKCLITLPSVAKKNGTKDIVHYTRHKDVDLYSNVYKLISKINDIEIHYNKNDICHYGTEVHIGSATLSKHVNSYIRQIFPDFEWHITDQHFAEYFIEDDFNNLPYPDIRNSSNHWEGYKFNGMDYKYIHNQRDWAFLMRRSIKDGVGMPRTVHILFGIAGSGRKSAVDYFIRNYPAICQRGSEDYLLAAEVDSNGVMLNETVGFTENLLPSV